MSILVLFVEVGLIWLCCWAVKTLFPIEPQGQKVITVVAVVVSILLVLSAFGLLPAVPTVPRLR
jgi:hypothetical protein